MIDGTNEEGKTALYVAIEAGHFSLAENLLNDGANPATYCESEDQWLLEVAILKQAPKDFVQRLLNHGASTSAKNSQGQSIIIVLEAQGKKQLATELRQHAQYQKNHMPRQLWEMRQQLQTMQTTIARQEGLIKQQQRLIEQLMQRTEPQVKSSEDALQAEKQSKQPTSPQSTFFAKPTVDENKEKEKIEAQSTDEDFYDYPKKEDKPSNG